MEVVRSCPDYRDSPKSDSAIPTSSFLNLILVWDVNHAKINSWPTYTKHLDLRCPYPYFFLRIFNEKLNKSSCFKIKGYPSLDF